MTATFQNPDEFSTPDETATPATDRHHEDALAPVVPMPRQAAPPQFGNGFWSYRIEADDGSIVEEGWERAQSQATLHPNLKRKVKGTTNNFRITGFRPA